MSLDERNAELEKQLEINPIDEQIHALVRASRYQKWYSVALSIIVIGLVIVAYRTFQLARVAQSNKDAVIASCETSNAARKNNTVLWDFLLEQQPQRPQTEQQIKLRKDFIDLKNKTFAPRDCMAEIQK